MCICFCLSKHYTNYWNIRTIFVFSTNAFYGTLFALHFVSLPYSCSVIRGYRCKSIVLHVYFEFVKSAILQLLTVQDTNITCIGMCRMNILDPPLVVIQLHSLFILRELRDDCSYYCFHLHSVMRPLNYFVWFSV